MDIEKPLVSNTPFTWYFMVGVGVLIQNMLVLIYKFISKKTKTKTKSSV